MISSRIRVLTTLFAVVGALFIAVGFTAVVSPSHGAEAGGNGLGATVLRSNTCIMPGEIGANGLISGLVETDTSLTVLNQNQLNLTCKSDDGINYTGMAFIIVFESSGEAIGPEADNETCGILPPGAVNLPENRIQTEDYQITISQSGVVTMECHAPAPPA